MSKKKIIFVIVFIVLIVGGFAGYQVYENHVKEEVIASEKTIISKRYKAFNKEKDRTKKLEDLKSIIKESNKYSKSKDSYSEVKKEYNSKIKQMRKYFIEGYDKSIADNTLTDVDNIGDKTQLNTAKDNLNAVLISIKDEIETVSTKEEVAKYEEKINALTTSYSNRVTAIEEAERKAEEERKAKEEAKAKAEAEAKKSSSSNSSSNSSSSSRRRNNSSSSSSSSSSNRGNSSNSGLSSSYDEWFEVDGKKSYRKGNRYWDDAGNKWHFDENGDVVLGW